MAYDQEAGKPSVSFFKWQKSAAYVASKHMQLCVPLILSVTSGKPEAPCFLIIAKSFMDGIYRQKYINPEIVVQLNEK